MRHLEDFLQTNLIWSAINGLSHDHLAKDSKLYSFNKFNINVSEIVVL